MKITHISPEFTYNKVYGTLSMKEKKSFFASKLVKFDSSISIENQNIIYYQNINNEQLNLTAEQLLGPKIYNTNSDKLTNSSLVINKSQTNTQLSANTSWILTVNYGAILKNFLFATLKKYRTFEGVSNNITLNNDINYAINQYVVDNLVQLYQLTNIDLFITYNNLNSPIRNNTYNINIPLLQNSNLFTEKIADSNNLISTYTPKNDTIKMVNTITFNQEKPSSKFSYNYYYNLYFTKI